MFDMHICALTESGLDRLMKLICDFLCLLKGFSLFYSFLLPVKEMMFLVDCVTFR